MFFKPFKLPEPPIFSDNTFNILDYGAKENDDITEPLKVAINNCSAAGGGKVVVPCGSFKCGPIHFKDNVNLHLSKGSKIEFVTDFYAYLPVVYGTIAGNRVYSVSHFLYAYKCKNIAITGSGIFDGNGHAWWPMKHHQPGMQDLVKKGKAGVPVKERVYDKPEDGVRPRMCQFVECENVLIEGVTFINSPSWTVHPAWCKNITVRNLTIKSPQNSHNTDGINLESCKRALVENCFVATGDDMICLKAGRDEDAFEVGIPCEDVEIRNCHSTDGKGCLTIGSETSASIRNAYIHDCHFGKMQRCVRIKTMKGRGGVVENIDFENLSIDEATIEAISITMRYAGEPLDDQSGPIENMPKVRNLSIKGLNCKNAARSMCLFGVNGYNLENIHLEDINITAKEGSKIEYVSPLVRNNVTVNVKRDK